jgi:hypothetical protein
VSQSDIEAHGESTGDARVDAVVARLDDLEHLDLPAQLEVFAELQASLATILDTPQDSQAVPDDAPLLSS